MTRVLVVGPGWHMTSGVSHYTYRLATELATRHQVSALLMRRLVPRQAYPGANRVGAALTDAAYPADMPVYDGIDWYWGSSMSEALSFLDAQRPQVVVLQWWTGAVLHSYLRLAAHAVRHGAKVILEWHESQDTGEAALPGTRGYVTTLLPRLLARSAAHVVHSEFDSRAIGAAYRQLAEVPVRVIRHGPYDHLTVAADRAGTGSNRAWNPAAPCRLLYFGVVRPYKGVDDLVAAFSSLDRAEAERFRLTIVGETWQGWTGPARAIAASPHADLIYRVDRYVTDAELASHFDLADAVVLPYRRSSASGPLQIAMSAGLPVVVSDVGGLTEAVRDYAGAVPVPPRDHEALRAALLRLPAMRGHRFADPHSWQHTVHDYGALIDELLDKPKRRPVLRETAPIPVVRETAPIPVVPETAPIPAVQAMARVSAVRETAPVPVVHETAPVPVQQPTGSVPVPVQRATGSVQIPVLTETAPTTATFSAAGADQR
jgi:glycosyltransferase involved in cell wall biosynthesis